jgi:hypothetical protein
VVRRWGVFFSFGLTSWWSGVGRWALGFFFPLTFGRLRSTVHSSPLSWMETSAVMLAVSFDTRRREYGWDLWQSLFVILFSSISICKLLQICSRLREERIGQTQADKITNYWLKETVNGS